RARGAGTPGHAAMSDDLTRYHRQMLLPGFGEDGQRRLLASTAAVLGCGALGSLIADLLARAGVGQLVIVDRDLIELTNLQRQVLFDEQDVADSIPKAAAARRRIARINSGVRVTAVVDDLNHANIERYAAGADVLVDGLDNFEARYLANDFAVKHGVPYIYGGAVGTVGAAYAILPHTSTGDAPWERGAGGSRATPCLRCLFEEAPPPGTSPTCDAVGVLGPAVATIASFQAAEALKVLTGNFERVCPTLLNIDVWTNTIAQLRVASAYDHGECPCCKHGRFEYLDGERGSGATTLCGQDAVQLTHKQATTGVDLEEIAARLREHGDVVANRYMLRVEIIEHGKPYALSVFPDGRAIVHGTAEASVARSIYSKYVGI
ncbi:MAG: ThiF family adenylyltransferase, partial [Nitrococcus sp.]|nr:ThiF family adenylyltransferase [Nitrococcus sp.]